jgi:hypothetical protein
MEQCARSPVERTPPINASPAAGVTSSHIRRCGVHRSRRVPRSVRDFASGRCPLPRVGPGLDSHGAPRRVVPSRVAGLAGLHRRARRSSTRAGIVVVREARDSLRRRACCTLCTIRSRRRMHAEGGRRRIDRRQPRPAPWPCLSRFRSSRTERTAVPTSLIPVASPTTAASACPCLHPSSFVRVRVVRDGAVPAGLSTASASRSIDLRLFPAAVDPRGVGAEHPEHGRPKRPPRLERRDG